ncbi:hypothetical protein V5799_014487 [Amblyomma americanum]|uniref:C2H2-type domain-containing protein n=1 Tax=Amblyomma americanum TaxID=6943 RepID=A0AAQ4E2W2_AMBAM
MHCVVASMAKTEPVTSCSVGLVEKKLAACVNLVPGIVSVEVNGCGPPHKNAGKKRTRIEHMDAEKPYGCAICGVRYKTRPGLAYHYVQSHFLGSSSSSSGSGGGGSGSGGGSTGGGGSANASGNTAAPSTADHHPPSAATHQEDSGGSSSAPSGDSLF